MGTGGMRCGAGRPAHKVKADHCRRLDVRRWHREGMLKPGSFGTWQWTDRDTGEVRSSIGYRAEADRLLLDYSIDGKPSGHAVRLETTPCNYGGTRPWFVCPVRGERVAVLFLRAGRFACRHCQRIAYASQSEDMIGRIWRKQGKVEAKLGENWRRPKGMHETTHERLLAIIWKCEERQDEAIAGKFLAMVRRHPFLDGRN